MLKKKERKERKKDSACEQEINVGGFLAEETIIVVGSGTDILALLRRSHLHGK